jgi:hypothetical protein
MKKEVLEARKTAMRAAFDKAKKADDGVGFSDAVGEQFEALLKEISEGTVDSEDFTKFTATIDTMKTESTEGKAKYAALLQTVTDLKKSMEGSGGEGKSPTLRAVLEKKAADLKAMRTDKGLSMTFEAALTVGGSILGDNKDLIPMPALDAQIAKPATPTRTVLQDVNLGSTGSTRIVYVDKSPRNGVAMFIGEGTLKPAIDFTYTPSMAEVVKIAVTTKVSNEMLDDISFIESEIRNDLYEEVMLQISRELITHQTANAAASGKLATLTGIGTAYVNAGFADKVANPNTADALYAAASQIRQLGYSGGLTAYVSQTSADLMKLNKATTGEYIGYGSAMEGIRVVGSPDLSAGQFVIGDFSKFYVRMYNNITIEVGYGNVEIGGKVVSDWEANFVTFRAEARLASYIKTNDKLAFVVGDLDTVKADIAAA